MGRSVWVEAAINGPWGRDRQPGIPISVPEIVADAVAAAEAGAAIVHLHAYDEATGRQRDEADIYARIIDGIRAKVDVLVYPTLPLRGSAYADDRARGRYDHVAELATRGLIEWSVVDPGSVNFSTFDEIRRNRPGFVYLNPEDEIREGLAVCARHRLRPSYAIYEPGFARLGAALAAHVPDLPRPIYRLMLSEDFAWGFPPAPYAVEAYARLLADCAPGADVMLAGLGVDLAPLLPAALDKGLHLRVGLEDARLGTDATNRELVQACVRSVMAAGCRPATVAEVRAAGG